MSSHLTRMSENRSRLDGAMLQLADKMRRPVGFAAQLANERGLWSLDDLAPEIRRNIKTIEEIETSQDLTLLLSVTLSAWSAVFEEVLGQRGVTFQLVDEVRRIRNDYAHNQGNYGDDEYVADSLQALFDLMQAIPEPPATASSPASNTAVRLTISTPFNNDFSRFAHYSPIPTTLLEAFLTALGFGTSEEFEKGIEFLTKQISLRPAGVQVLYSFRGLFYATLGDPYQAIRDCYDAISIDSQFSMAYVIRAVAHCRTKDYNHAVVDATTAISLDSSNGYAFFQRGVAYSWGADRAATLSDYGQAMFLNSNDLMARFNRGYYLMGGGNNAELLRAIDDFTDVINAMPTIANAWSNRGVCQERLGKGDLALADYERASIVEPENVIALTNMAVIYSSLGRWDTSIELGQRVTALAPDYVLAWIQLSWAYINKKQYGKAVEAAKLALTLDPTHQQARINLRVARSRRWMRRILWSLLIAIPVIVGISILADMI